MCLIVSIILFVGILPEALETNCRRCTEKQKIGALRTIRRLRKEYPKVWEEVAKLWDPTGEYIERFESTTISKKDQERSPAPTTTTVPIFNRFDDAINNDIVPEVSQASSSTPRVASTTTTRVVTQRSSSTTRKSTTTLRSTSSTKSFTTTRTERGSSSEMPTTTPSDGFPKPTLKNIFNVRVPENGKLPILYQIKIPVISVASEKIIDSLSNISNKVVKVGTFATKMLFSTIHAIVGKHAENKA